MEAVFRAARADMGISLNGSTAGRVFGLPLGSLSVTALIDRYLHFCFRRCLFGIEMDFGDRRPVARLARPA